MLHLAAGEASPDARSQGWTFVTKSTFASKEDMDYYDQSCEAHKKLKAFVAGVREDVMTVYFEAKVESRM